MNEAVAMNEGLDISKWNRSDDGCRGYRILPNGRALFVFEDNPFYYRLCVSGATHYGYYDNVYCYTNRDVALQQMDIWDGTREHEPTGWVKNPSTGRHRDGGDENKEWAET
jgi:hypothetical protein